jgi:hypothetical protein
VEILPGDVLFVWGDGFIDDAIEFVSRGPSHCAVFLDGQTVAEARAGRKSGTAYLDDYLSVKEKRLEVWSDETLTSDERKKMVAYAKAHFGIKYDYDAIAAELAHFELGITLSDKWDEGKEYICSFYVNDCGKSVRRKWAKVNAPAPVDLITGGKLTRKGVLRNAK